MASLARQLPSWCGSASREQIRPCSSRAAFHQQRRQRDACRQLSVQAIQVSGPTPSFDERPDSVDPDTQRISAQLIASMQEKIKEALEADHVQVTDAYGNGQHVSIDVVSSLFEDQSSMKRQRMVYKAIWYELQSAVHAVDGMTTKTPAEAAEGR